MSFGLSNRGEELLSKNSFTAFDFELSLYVDDCDIDGDGKKEGDDLTDADDLTDVTTEPDIVRASGTVQESNIQQINGDWGFNVSTFLNTENSTANVDGFLIIEEGTTNLIGRSEIQDPTPGPFQDLTGVNSINFEPEVTID